WKPMTAAAGSISKRCWTVPDKPLTPQPVHNGGMKAHALIAAAALLCSACAPSNERTSAMPDTSSSQLRLATYNTSLYSNESGGLIRELQGDSAHARKIAAVLQQNRPDLVLLNEFDFDEAHRAADLFQQRYLAVAQTGGGEPLNYPYRYL